MPNFNFHVHTFIGQQLPNLGLEIDYPDWGLSWIFSFSPGKFQASVSNYGPNCFLSLFPDHLIFNAIEPELLTVSQK
jgi:hypothetical protein